MCFQCGWMGLLTYDLTLCLAHAYTYVQKVSKYLAKEHKFETKLTYMPTGYMYAVLLVSGSPDPNLNVSDSFSSCQVIPLLLSSSCIAVCQACPATAHLQPLSAIASPEFPVTNWLLCCSCYQCAVSLTEVDDMP